jgi:hypothetical protein
MLRFHRVAAVAATCVGVAALAVPAALADPPGSGLFTQHRSTCTYPNGSTWTGYVTLLPEPAGGATFWANGTHLLIQSGFTATTDAATEGTPFTIGKGQKAGLTTKATIKCHGYFPDYDIWVTSFSIPRP